MKYNFIKTTDEETKNNLLNEGFKLVSQDENIFTFINDNTINFADKTRIQYSNMLCV